MAEIQLRIPGPTSLVRAAFRVVEWEVEVVRLVGSLPARVVVLLEDVDGIMGRVKALLDDAERTVAAIDGIVVSAVETVDGVRATMERANQVIDDVSRTVESADRMVLRVDGTVTTADGLVTSAGTLIGRVEPLLDFADSALAPVRPVVEALLVDAELDPEAARRVAARLVEVLAYADRTLTTIQPIADEILASLDPREVVAMVDLVGRVRQLVDFAETALAPVRPLVEELVVDVEIDLDVARLVASRLVEVLAYVDKTVASLEPVADRLLTSIDPEEFASLVALVGRVGPLVEFAETALAPVRPVVETLLVDAELDPEAVRDVATRVVGVLAYADKTLTAIEPIADEVLTSIDPHEVAAMVRLIDHLPLVVNTLEKDVLPVLASLDNVGPEVHQILEVAQQCLEALAGIPGFQFLRRRGESGNGNGNS